LNRRCIATAKLKKYIC